MSIAARRPLFLEGDEPGVERKGDLSSPTSEIFSIFGCFPTTSANVSVTPDNAMRCNAVYASVRVISESVAQLPLHLYARGGDGSKSRADSHPLERLLSDAPNEWQSSFEFRQFMETSLSLRGNAYAYVNRVGAEIEELIPLQASRVETLVPLAAGPPTYRYTDAYGRQAIYPATDILHLREFGTSPYIGASPIEQGREAIALAIVMEQYAAKLFGSGARPSGVLKIPKGIGEDAIKRMITSWNAAHAGGSNSGKTAALEDGTEWQQLSLSSVDSQFMELRRDQIIEIARLFRIPPTLLQDIGRATFNNAESLGQQFVSMTLLPRLHRWEGALQRLLRPEERATYYAEFLVDDLARADIAARFAAYAQAVTNGLLNPNEVRGSENRPPYAGGDEFRRPLNTEVPGQKVAA